MMGGRADVVMSDMAPNTTGHRKTDQLRIVGLIETAAAFAADVLNPGGTFLAKAFQSGADAELVAQLKRDFASVRHVKPASSRQDSSERYVLAMDFVAPIGPEVQLSDAGVRCSVLGRLREGEGRAPSGVIGTFSRIGRISGSGAVCLSACSPTPPGILQRAAPPSGKEYSRDGAEDQGW